MSLEIGTKKEKTQFELVVAMRDRNGNYTGSTKSISSDSGYDISNFWDRNSHNPNKNKKRNSAAAGKPQIDAALKEAENYTRMIRRKRKLED